MRSCNPDGELWVFVVSVVDKVMLKPLVPQTRMDVSNSNYLMFT